MTCGFQDVHRAMEEREIRFVELWFTDVLGFLRSVTVKAQDLETYVSGGLGIDGSSIAGFTVIEDSDLLARPDIGTFREIPWGRVPTARVFCDIVHEDGTPFAGDPRGILRRNLLAADDMGYRLLVKPELEYFYIKDASKLEPLDKGGYFHVPPSDMASGLRQETAIDLESMGLEVDFVHHEAGEGQAEIEVKFAEALTTADNAVTYRAVAREVARRNGAFVTFMPKPFSNINGSGMHVHNLLLKGDRNAFHDPGAEDGLSDVGRYYIGGLLEHAPAMTAITCQWVNSYKRLQPGFEAPVFMCWGSKNRSALIRIPAVREGREGSMRIEYRAPDPACNPYLVLSALLAAGLDGVRHGTVPPEPIETDIFKLTRAERHAIGVHSLPQTLGNAIERMEDSEFMRECLGDHVFRWFIRDRWAEWDEYHGHVSDWEIERYLRIL